MSIVVKLGGDIVRKIVIILILVVSVTGVFFIFQLPGYRLERALESLGKDPNSPVIICNIINSNEGDRQELISYALEESKYSLFKKLHYEWDSQSRAAAIATIREVGIRNLSDSQKAEFYVEIGEYDKAAELGEISVVYFLKELEKPNLEPSKKYFAREVLLSLYNENKNKVSNLSSDKPIIIVPKGKVMIVVEQKLDHKRLYQGTVNVGQDLEFNAMGSVLIRYDVGENLAITRDGIAYEANSGMGYIMIP